MILNKRFLRKLYNCYKDIPPFCSKRMPPARKVTFEVTNDEDYLGMFIPYPMRIQITTYNSNFHLLTETLLHEMVHLYLFYNNHTDYNQHEEKFKQIADEICEVLMLDKEKFI
jgi:predicted SprT family Zn-dependent metalloprotease